MQSRAYSLFHSTFRNSEFKEEAVQDQENSLEAALESDIESPLFKMDTGHATAPAINPSLSKPPLTLKPINTMRKMDYEESKCIFAVEAGPNVKTSAKEAPSDIFYVVIDEANTGLKISSY